ncbi:23S rRNA (adenine2030-N6)-methyltransferase [Gemmobacter megaterium]|uniref:Ribosomal RNA large subunit methyltransferase J n=1 Tax=Gemmobacter megaterium TaxID=1086013 RepID=A0A1N7LUK6_9RHOB|nr:23S rRNA (adenine(2030)-N(6))-methyltransferase RlmJ [Gemmobacter megaterium]GGE10591.1 ribosomal RNA large subunit methyltransferase J [Gemmobacter megaterium]SIS77391.1 23S rRNA (adenine2030-N6)-methyltransferase [Gemmobacter megaterium]
MLSYQHIYHAGNPADVQKHALLAWLLDYMTAKDKALTYMETHSGRGLYALDAPEAVKTGEAAAGIARMEAGFPPDHPYRRCLDAVRAVAGPSAYPGSPRIAAALLRPFDRIVLAELHPREHAALCEAMADVYADVRREDGLAMALSMCPPTPRRGVLVIDPSYEVKEDYDRLPGLIGAIARKWPVGVIVLWYPLLTGGAHRPMLERLVAAHPEALRHEVRFAPVRPGHRMVGSGMFVINPAWGMAEEAARISALFRDLGV